MEPLTVAVLVVAGVLLLAWYLWWTAARLDRLHTRVETAKAALDAQLLRRSTVALELAASGLLDPASAMLLAGAAHSAAAAGPADRELAESDLTKGIRAALAEPEAVDSLRAEPVGRELLDELDTAVRRVQLARRFHNDRVRATRAVRRRRLVRWLRLAGGASPPDTFEMDDDVRVGSTART